MLVHATASDLTAWTGTTAPANATALLRSASLLVDEATVTAVYATDDTGKATDTTVLGALRDATCAQAAAWAALGVDPVAGPAQQGATPVSSKTLGSGSVSYDTSAAASVTVQTARARAVTELADDARRILAAAGLLRTAIG